MFGFRGFSLLLILIFTHRVVFSLGLGELTVKSRLNDPLLAEVALFSEVGEGSAEIKISQVAPEQGEETALRDWWIDGLKFRQIDQGNGQSLIQITSRDRILEPALNLWIRVESEEIAVSREYTLFIDPPGYEMGNQPPIVTEPKHQQTAVKTALNPQAGRTLEVKNQRALATAPADKAETSSVNSLPPTEESGLYTVQNGETISVLGFKLRPDRDVAGAQMSLALYKSNPEAFYRGDINRLMVGSKIRIPDRQEALAVSYNQAMQTLLSEAKGEPSKAGAIEQNREQAVDSAQADLPEIGRQSGALVEPSLTLLSDDNSQDRVEELIPELEASIANSRQQSRNSNDSSFVEQEMEIQQSLIAELTSLVDLSNERVTKLRAKVEQQATVIKDQGDRIERLEANITELRQLQLPAGLAPTEKRGAMTVVTQPIREFILSEPRTWGWVELAVLVLIIGLVGGLIWGYLRQKREDSEPESTLGSYFDQHVSKQDSVNYHVSPSAGDRSPQSVRITFSSIKGKEPEQIADIFDVEDHEPTFEPPNDSFNTVSSVEGETASINGVTNPTETLDINEFSVDDLEAETQSIIRRTELEMNIEDELNDFVSSDAMAFSLNENGDLQSSRGNSSNKNSREDELGDINFLNADAQDDLDIDFGLDLDEIFESSQNKGEGSDFDIGAFDNIDDSSAEQIVSRSLEDADILFGESKDFSPDDELVLNETSEITEQLVLDSELVIDDDEFDHLDEHFQQLGAELPGSTDDDLNSLDLSFADEDRAEELPTLSLDLEALEDQESLSDMLDIDFEEPLLEGNSIEEPIFVAEEAKFTDQDDVSVSAIPEALIQTQEPESKPEQTEEHEPISLFDDEYDDDFDKASSRMLSEIDLNIMYGEFIHAEELIRNHLTEKAEDEELRLRLLRVLYHQKNRGRFISEVMRFKKMFPVTESPNWSELKEMGRELLPGNQQFL